MKASMKWMNDYVAVEGLDFMQLADTLTQAGIPVEEVVSMDRGISRIFTGRITEVAPHPDAERLSVCQIDCLSMEGNPETKQICTSATNVKPGQIVPVAYHKAKLPGGKKINRGKMRGVMSDGMMCSINELGYGKEVFLQEETEGIFILPNETPVGENILDVMGLNDTVFEFELTPNRADCFSMVGLSREIAVMTNQEAKMPEITLTEVEQKASDVFTNSIEDADLCTRFSTRVIRNVKVQESPLWLQNRLRNVGIRPINNIVDVTNYVMMELGQPMHAYDFNQLAGHGLVARRAYEDESIVTLDGAERKLTQDMLVIADAAGAVGIAGIMGGQKTEVTANTTDIVLEAANFYGKSIRRSAKALGLRTEASGRFEKGVNADMTTWALDRASQLIQSMDAGVEVLQGIVDVYPLPKEERTVLFTAKAVNHHLGTDIAEDTMVQILERLHFTVKKEGESYVVTIPSWRDDVVYMCDIAEEIARIYGYDNITPTTPVANLMSGGKTPMASLIGMMKKSFVEAGLNECITFSFMHKDSLSKLNLPETDARYLAVPILNPISEEFPYMRTTLVSSLLDVAYKNISKKNQDVWMFESAAVYEPKSLPVNDFVFERQMIAGVMTGRVSSPAWPHTYRETDFYDVKGVLESVWQDIGLSGLTIERIEEPYLHPGISAVYKSGEAIVARLGELHPEVSAKYDLPEHTFIFEIDLGTILAQDCQEIRYREISKYPGISRDLAIVAPKNVTHDEILSTMKAHAGAHLQNVYLFDVYEGEHIQEGYRSMAYALSFQALDRTLEDQDVESAVTAILAALEEIGCSLR